MELFFQCRLRLKVVGTFFSSSRGPTILEKKYNSLQLVLNRARPSPTTTELRGNNDNSKTFALVVAVVAADEQN